MVQQQNSGNEK